LSAFALKELIQVLLDKLKLLIEILQNIDETLDVESAISIPVLIDTFHFILKI